MPVLKPYKRTVRQLLDGTYQTGGNGAYVKHPQFATAATHYLRAFQIFQRDLLELFDYIEPSDVNLPCYSHRILELYARCCFEVETNFKAILSENGYASPGDWTMTDYRKVNQSHRLSSYEVKLPVWEGAQHTRSPFGPWQAAGGLPWYRGYNSVKHSRHVNFNQANFGNLIDAACGLVVLISSQFLDEDGGPTLLSVGGPPSDGFEFASGQYFLVKFPHDWPIEDRYSFVWGNVSAEADPIQSYPY